MATKTAEIQTLTHSVQLDIPGTTPYRGLLEFATDVARQWGDDVTVPAEGDVITVENVDADVVTQQLVATYTSGAWVYGADVDIYTANVLSVTVTYAAATGSFKYLAKGFKFSVNDGLRKGAGNTAKEAFSMYGSAGGHKTMARAELDLKLIRKEIKAVGKKALGDWIISVIKKTAGKKIK